MPEDIDEIYTADELLGIWNDNEPEKEDDPWDFRKHSPLYDSDFMGEIFAAKERELVLTQSKQQALNILIPMLLKGRPVLSARKLCRVASFSVGGMEYPDVEMILVMADYAQFACAKRREPDKSEDSFRGYSSEDWRYTHFRHYENNQSIGMPWVENLALSSRKVLATLPVVLSFEIDIDTDKGPRVSVPFREFHIAAPIAEFANITKFIVAHNRQPGKYKLPTNLEEWQNAIVRLDYNDYICR